MSWLHPTYWAPTSWFWGSLRAGEKTLLWYVIWDTFPAGDEVSWALASAEAGE